MNGEPQDSTTSSRPGVEGLRSISDQNIHGNAVPQGPYTDPRIVARREHSDGDLAGTRVVSRGPEPIYNHSVASNESHHQYHGGLQAFVPPRMESLAATHDQAREEIRRRAALKMIQRQRELRHNYEEHRRRATEPFVTPQYMPRRHGNSISTGVTYRRTNMEHPEVGNGGSPTQPASSSQALENQQAGYVPPRWQPDAEVTNCPICNHAFSFFFRKHHCRKCGRVVCANCSPHRITIPRQYIVNQPTVHPIEIDLSNDTRDQDNAAASLAATQMYPGLGGGQEVRLCNPCVPDPHPFSPPPYSSTPQALPIASTLRRPTSDTHTTARRRSHHTGSVPLEYSRYHAIQSNPATVYRSTPQYQPQPTVIGSNTPYGSAPDSPAMYMQRQGYPRTHRQHASLSVLPSARSRAMFEAMTDPDEPPAREEPIRQIPEEDECPICHEELPPKGPDGSEVDREAHVSFCIEGHFSSSRPRDVSMPDPSTAIAAAVAASAATPSQAGSSVPSSGIAGPSVRRRTTGMVVYHATEKDCIGEDGATQECIICFEDFEPGVEMGRLECLCKFHKACIRKWWDTKGQGSCPTHQLHD